MPGADRGLIPTFFPDARIETVENQTDFDFAIPRFAQGKRLFRNPRSCRPRRLLTWTGSWRRSLLGTWRRCTVGFFAVSC